MTEHSPFKYIILVENCSSSGVEVGAYQGSTVHVHQADQYLLVQWLFLEHSHQEAGQLQYQS